MEIALFFHKYRENELYSLFDHNLLVEIHSFAPKLSFHDFDGLPHRKNGPAIIDDDETVKWYIHGKLHRDCDDPAVLRADGELEWWKDGNLFRENDKPTVVCGDHCEWWSKCEDKSDAVDSLEMYCAFLDDYLDIMSRMYRERLVNRAKLGYWRHRDNDMPAVTSLWGIREWWMNGRLHRDNDLPSIMYKNQDYCYFMIVHIWYTKGCVHREGDKPAIIRHSFTWSGNNSEHIFEWFESNTRHRKNALPAIVDDHGEMEWYMFGKQVGDSIPYCACSECYKPRMFGTYCEPDQI
jgi:hypothetical protein